MFLVRRVIVILILIIFALNLRVPGISISKHSIKIVGPEERVNLDEDADTIVFHRLPGSDTLQIFKRRGKIILLFNDTAEETVTIRHSPFTFSPSDTLFIPAENIKIKEIRINNKPIDYNMINLKDSVMIVVPLQYGDNKIFLSGLISGREIDTTLFCFRNRKFYKIAVISSRVSPFFKALRFYTYRHPEYKFKFYLMNHGVIIELNDFYVNKMRTVKHLEADFWVVYGLKALKNFPEIQEKCVLILSPEDGRYIKLDSFKIHFQDTIYTLKEAGIVWKNLNLKKVIARSSVLGNYPVAGISGNNIAILTIPDLWEIQKSSPLFLNRMLTTLFSYVAVPKIKLIQNLNKLYIILSPPPQENQYLKIKIDGKPYYGLLEFPGIIPLPELSPGDHQLFIEIRNNNTTLFSKDIDFSFQKKITSKVYEVEKINRIPSEGLYIKKGFIEARQNIIFIFLTFSFIFLTWIFEKLQEVTS